MDVETVDLPVIEFGEKQHFHVLLASLLISVSVAAGLAGAYTHGGGIEVMSSLGEQQSLQVDSYVFTAVLLAVTAPLTLLYFYLYRDVSEAVMLPIGVFWSLHSGLVDIFVYLFLGRLPPATLPWLEDSLTVGPVSRLLGFETVTRVALFATPVLTFVGVVLPLVWGLSKLELEDRELL